MFLIHVFQNERFNRFLRLFVSLINNNGALRKCYFPRFYVCKFEGNLDRRNRSTILSCERVFIQLKIGWRGVLELADLFRLRTRTFEAKNCQAVSADAVFCFLNIFVENERTNAE